MPFILLAAYATGITLATIYSPPGKVGHIVIAGILLLIWGVSRKSGWAWIPVLGLLCLTGFLNSYQHLHPPAAANHIGSHAGNTYKLIEATIETIEQRDAGGYRLLTQALNISDDGTTHLPARGKILLYTGEGNLPVRPGQVVRWRSRLRKPFRFGNPGEFNYPRYLASRDVYVTAYVKNAGDIVVIENHPDRQGSWFEGLRFEHARRIQSILPDSQAGLVQSLLLGVRSGISPSQRQVLADGGIAHLFAISGLHFGLLALFLYQVGKFCYTRCQLLMYWQPPQKVIPVLLVLPLAAYMMITGCSWATMRAFLMVSAASALIVCNRRVKPFDLLALVALCLLLFNPLALFQAGFQLSFSGVAGILALLPGWQGKTANLPRLLRWPALLFLTTLAATIFTTPALLWHFHQVSPGGLVINIIAVPLIAWGAVPLGLASLMLRPLSSFFTDCSLQVTGTIVEWTMVLTEQLCALPTLQPVLFYLTTSKLIVLTGLLLLLVPLKHTGKPWKIRFAILVATIVSAAVLQTDQEHFEITAFSVGQGDATLISIAGEKHFLVDGGGLPKSSIDTGKDLVAPALGRMGVGQLEAVILTHNHPDHSSGLTYILNRFPVKTFYHGEETVELPLELQRAITANNVSVVTPPPGWKEIFRQGDTSVSLFVPEQNRADKNEQSIITYAGNTDTGALLAADAGRKAYQQLEAAGLPGPVDLLKLPHHGSRHSAPELFLERLKPSRAFVSAGRNNPYGFPHEETVSACRENRSLLYRTDLDGMLRFRQFDSSWSIATGTGKPLDKTGGKKLYN